MSKLRLVLVLHFVVLVALRLFTDADDFNNWDLISFLNANAFTSIQALLGLPEVHLHNPFSFPVYNTGAESVVSILVHGLAGKVSLYWSPTVVLVVYDTVFLAALYRLFGLVFTDTLLECLAWILVAMSPVLLTFPSISAFDMQAFATIALALLGCEYVLQSRQAPGLVLLVVAFGCISQAYPLTFYLPLFCLAWLASRSMLLAGGGDGGRRILFGRALPLLSMIVAGTAGVEMASGGMYLEKASWVISSPLGKAHDANAVGAATLDRLVTLLQVAFAPRDAAGHFTAGFAPYFLLVALLTLGVLALGIRLRPPPRSADGGTPAGSAASLLALPAWAGLVVFGYTPALFGANAKSQRCFFGDLFLALAVVAVAQWLLRRHVRASSILAPVLLLLCLSDAYYVSSVLGVDHSRNHSPIFDYDPVDGIVRHDMVSAIRRMRDQVAADHAGLIVYYPRGAAENTTDPAMFFARFLRHFGPFQKDGDLIFPCHFCDVRYGCPFPDARRQGCGKRCCYRDPAQVLGERPGLRARTLYLWWYSDSLLPDEPRRSRMLASLRRSYRISEFWTPAQEKRWQCFELTPRSAGKTPRKGIARAGRSAHT